MKRNITDWERAGSIVAERRSGRWRSAGPKAAIAAAVAAGGLLLRGIIGYCPLSAVDRTRHPAPDTREALGGSRGVHVREIITIARPVEEVYAFWRDFSNLPRFMRHLARVETLDRTRSRWIAKAPAGLTVSWDAHIINEIPNELIAWSSVGDADVISAGSVHFKPLPSGGTRIVVHLQYDPPAGKLGAWVASLFGEEPSQQIREDLRRLKSCVETGRAPGEWRSSTTGAVPAYSSRDGKVQPFPQALNDREEWA